MSDVVAAAAILVAFTNGAALGWWIGHLPWRHWNETVERGQKNGWRFYRGLWLPAFPPAPKREGEQL